MLLMVFAMTPLTPFKNVPFCEIHYPQNKPKVKGKTCHSITNTENLDEHSDKLGHGLDHATHLALDPAMASRSRPGRSLPSCLPLPLQGRSSHPASSQCCNWELRFREATQSSTFSAGGASTQACSSCVTVIHTCNKTLQTRVNILSPQRRLKALSRRLKTRAYQI